MKHNIKITGLLVFAVFFISIVCSGQKSKDDAIEAFNRGIQYKQNGNLQKAIIELEESIQISKVIGLEDDNVRVKAEMALPKTYLDYGMELYKKKKIDHAIDTLIVAKQRAEEYGDPKTELQAKNIASQLYRIKGVNYYQKKAYDKALEAYSNAIKTDSGYARPYFNKALVYQKQDKNKELEEQIDIAIKKAEAGNDDKTLKKTKTLAKNYYYNKGVKAKKSSNYDASIKYLEKAVEYEPDENAYYLMAKVYNEKQTYDKAINAANEGLKIDEAKSSKEKARYYFELGRAYQGKGAKQQACDAYQKAKYGAYEKSAQYQMQHILKCQ
jgi:tetratricopeptide (TPR) repeat protein